MSAESQDKKPRGRPSSFDRQKLLDQVMELFWDRGYANLSFNEIGHAVGLTRASLYNAFETKEALFIKVLEQYLENSPAAALKNIKKGDPVGSGLFALFKNLAKTYAADHKNRGCMAVNCMNELMSGDEDLNKHVSKIYEGLKKRLKILVRQAIDQKELPNDTDVEVTANMILVFMNGFSVFSKSKTSEVKLKSMARNFMDKIGFHSNTYEE